MPFFKKNQTRISFQELKARVGVDDVAHALGYHLDKRAGIGKFFEMVLGSDQSKTDCIIIRNTENKACQTYFRRDGSKGDVVTFVRENIDSFNVIGNTEWQKIINVLSKFANIPMQSYREDMEKINANRGSKPFNPQRYEVRDIDISDMHKLFRHRGFDSKTVETFSPFIKLICDRENKNFQGFNIGFPYISLCQEEIVGYEIRGFGGFKSKASGTNSNSAAWIADLSGGNPSKVFVFESAFDAMAFHQLNQLKLNKDIALVSVGGTFSDNQILGVYDLFPHARLHDCFDNDIAGRINALRMLSIVENFPLKAKKDGDSITVNANGKEFTVTLERSVYAQISKQLSIRYKVGHWNPPKGFKDWNDCLLGKRLNSGLSSSKEDMYVNLAEKRKSSIKI